MIPRKLYWCSVVFVLVFSCRPLHPAQQVESTAYTSTGSDLVITVFDVGQADALYVKTPDNRHFVIDGGSPAMQLDDGVIVQSREILPLLKKRAVTALDAVFLTHPHPDHLNGLIRLVREIPVRTFYISGYDSGIDEYRELLAALDEKNIPLAVIRSGDRVEAGPSVFLEVLGPPRAFYFGDANNNSLILRVTCRDFRFLAAGDAETEELDWVAGALEAQLGSDVLKVPHHGSYDAVNGTFLDAVDPDCAIVSCGQGNPFGHPHRKTRAFYRKKGIQLFRTDLSGSLTVLSNGVQYCIVPEP